MRGFRREWGPPVPYRAQGASSVSIGKAKCLKTTAKAALMWIYSLGQQQWVPIRFIQPESAARNMGSVGDLVLDRRWCERQDLLRNFVSTR